MKKNKGTVIAWKYRLLIGQINNVVNRFVLRRVVTSRDADNLNALM